MTSEAADIRSLCMGAHIFDGEYKLWRAEALKRAKGEPFDADVWARHGLKDPATLEHIKGCSLCMDHLRLQVEHTKYPWYEKILKKVETL